MKGALIALALFLSCVAALNLNALTRVAERNTNSGLWTIVRDAQPTETLTYKILIKQQNLDKLEQIFWEVSDPQHVNYGKFLSVDEVKSLIAPKASSVKNVLSWLKQSGIPAEAVTMFSDYIEITSTVKQAANLFSASFAVYQSAKTQAERIRIVGEAHIPTELKEDIDFVSGISELIENTRIAPKSYPSPVEVTDDQYITPSVLQAYYNVPTTAATNQSNLQGIAAFSDYFSVGAYSAFDQHFSIDGVNVTIQGEDCLGEGCDQYESDLDVQYITSIGLGVPTIFIASNQNGQWVLDWAQSISNDQNAPLVNSISYGWSELEQCEITSGCQTYGYDSEQYVTRANTEFQAIGARGISIMVSDGDDGAPGLYGSSGNCPIDANNYCPSGGCNHTTTACAELTFTLTSNNTQCYFPGGIGSSACGILQDQELNPALQAWANANSNCDIAIEYDRMQMPHFYSSCSCSALKSHTAHGFTIAPYVFSQSNGAVFAADFPTSSPYVTSVSATQFTWTGTSVDSEIVCSIQTGAIITTGGGFSTFQAQPSYQAAAVAAWVQAGDNLPPSFAYNAKMRGYPDIAFNGHNYLVFASNNSQDYDQCPCAMLPVDGTSCSSPAFTGLVSMINDKLLNAGKSQLGFLNTLLYQMAASTPAAFHDITSGNNNCNRAYCCEYGYTATKGWDPASGLGSPDFVQFEQYVMSSKGL
jgi:subtilase family serine protease